MREIPLSENERSFVEQAIKQNQRIDGRKNDEFRSITINFGSEAGSVLVTLGETRILAQMSCELGPPKVTRPNEGMLFINVELGKMAASHLDSGRYSELSMQINRALERTFKDSACIDLESLCVIAEESVWILRLDINVLNHEGNLIDCCSIAALCALAHFKRPNVVVINKEAFIQSEADSIPIPIVLHHYPVCISYCIVDKGLIAIADPTALEERVADSLLVFGLNSFQELCCLNLGGTSLTSSTLLLKCAKKAAAYVKLVVDQVKESLKIDKEKKDSGKYGGFAEKLRLNKISRLADDRLNVKLRHFNFDDIQGSKREDPQLNCDITSSQKVLNIGKQAAILNSNLSNLEWIPENFDDDQNILNSSESSFSSEQESSS